MKKYSWDYAGDYSSGATGYNWTSANNWNQLNRIVLTSQSTNQVLCDLPNLDRYCSMLSPIATSAEELESKSSSFISGNGSLTVVGAGFFIGSNRPANTSRGPILKYGNS